MCGSTIGSFKGLGLRDLTSWGFYGSGFQGFGASGLTFLGSRVLLGLAAQSKVFLG